MEEISDSNQGRNQNIKSQGASTKKGKILHEQSFEFPSSQPHQSCELMEEISDSNQGLNQNKKSPGASTKKQKILHEQSFEFPSSQPHQSCELMEEISDSNQGRNQNIKSPDAAMAYDRASIKLRSYDSHRNFHWSQTTDLEAKFQSHPNMEVILKMIKDETYESKFNNFLREKIGKEKDDDLSMQKNCDNFRRLLFEKVLTPSDVGKLNRLIIPKKFAVAYFPPVPDNDHSEGFVNDEVILPFYDVDNKLWMFRYCYWKSSKSFVFTRGWNQFVKEKKLMANDKISFYYNEDLRSPNSGCFEIGTSLPKTNIGASLKLGMETQVRRMDPKEDEGIVEDREISKELSGEDGRLRRSCSVKKEKKDCSVHLRHRKVGQMFCWIYCQLAPTTGGSPIMDLLDGFGRNPSAPKDNGPAYPPVSLSYQMVLSSTYSTPPTSTPPTIEESIASIADVLSKLVASQTTFIAQFNVAFKNMTTQNERLSTLITNNSQPKNNMATYLPNSTSYTKKPKIILDDIVTLNTSTVNVTTTITEIDADTQPSPTVTTPPPKTQPNIIMPPPNNKGQLRISISYMAKIQNDADTQTRVPPPLIEEILATFRCVKTFFVGHKCYPPKFVLLESEDDPPWEPNDPRYKTMSLEDKARFKGGSIDTQGDRLVDLNDLIST
nr:hypothetical protein [Tanacetum cinerariifolium]